MKKILIVGGTGFIGYHLAKKALRKGWRVYSISTSAPKKKRYIPKVKYKICDITNKKKLKKNINQYFDYVVNLGGYVEHSHRVKTIKSHYHGCKNLADILIKNPPRTFVQMGSGNEYGKLNSPHNEKANCRPISIYGNAKLSSTKYLINLFKRKHFPSVVLRLYQAYGPKQDTNRLIPQAIESFLKNKKFPCSTGNQFRDFVHIEDVVGAIIQSLVLESSKGEIINIGSGKPKTIKSIILTILKIIGKGEAQFGKIKMRKDEILKIYPIVKKAQKTIKWSSKISLQKGLKRTVRSYSESFRN